MSTSSKEHLHFVRFYRFNEINDAVEDQLNGNAINPIFDSAFA
jgi:hypothetical protein